MADISVTPKRNGSRTWIWAIIAVALVIALMLWLAGQEGTTSPQPVEGADTAAAAGAPADTLSVDPTTTTAQ